MNPVLYQTGLELCHFIRKACYRLYLKYYKLKFMFVQKPSSYSGISSAR
jgi:hypothetical protein